MVAESGMYFTVIWDVILELIIQKCNGHHPILLFDVHVTKYEYHPCVIYYTELCFIDVAQEAIPCII